VTFREPLLLAGLVLVPLALAAYVAAQRRRRRYAVRYTNVPLLAAAAGRMGWLRHLPALLALLALGALVVAVARPERTVAAERREATVVLVSDTSGSMLAKDVPPDRLTAARAAARTLAHALPRDFRLGLVGFGSSADQLVEPTTDKQRVLRALDGLRVAGGTAMGDGLALGLEAARAPVTDVLGQQRRLPAALVLLSDGASTRGEDPITVAERARKLGVRIYTVALGTPGGTLERPQPDGSVRSVPVPPDRGTLQEIARETRGRHFAAADAEQLSRIYAGLGARLSRANEKQEVTAAFAGGGLALLLAGGILALARGGRLP
jgi:Ca-activated chloride channel family protein